MATDIGGMSPYEAREWQRLTTARPGMATRAQSKMTESAASAWGNAKDAAGRLATTPLGQTASQAVARVGDAVPEQIARRAQQAGAGAAVAAGKVVESANRGLVRAGSATLSPKRVVRAHQRRNHPVQRLSDLAGLDLELVDRVRPDRIDLAYAFAGAISGAATGATLTIGEVGAGASAGASLAVAGAAVLGDAAWVTAVSARAVAHVALYYGCDPNDTQEKLFAGAVLNWGSAGTAAAKQAAWADVSTLTQMLVRSAPWEKLNQTVTARIVGAFAKQMNLRVTKASLGKWVPFAGVAAGISLNSMMLTASVDAAQLAYRRRWFLEKYPNLDVADLDAAFASVGDDEIVVEEDDGQIEDDGAFSFVDEMHQAGVLDGDLNLHEVEDVDVEEGPDLFDVVDDPGSEAAGGTAEAGSTHMQVD